MLTTIISATKHYILSLDDKFIEILKFVIFVLMGSLVKLFREAKPTTFKRIIIEIIMSFFVAFIVYTLMVHIFKVENIIGYASASYAGSISSKFLDNMEILIDQLFKSLKEKIKNWIVKK